MSTFGKLLIPAVLLAAAMPGTARAAKDVPVKGCEDAGVHMEQLAVRANGKGIRSFYNGGALVMLIDQIEPAAFAYGLVILMNDPKDELGGRKCLAVTNFNYLDIDSAKSHYDPKTGVTLIIPAMDYGERGSVKGKPLKVNLKLKAESSTVTASR